MTLPSATTATKEALPEASAASGFDFRVERLSLRSGVGDAELPVYIGLLVVGVLVPGRSCLHAHVCRRSRHVQIRAASKAQEVAFAEACKQSGHQFDPACATAFLDIQEQIMESMVQLW